MRRGESGIGKGVRASAAMAIGLLMGAAGVAAQPIPPKLDRPAKQEQQITEADWFKEKAGAAPSMSWEQYSAARRAVFDQLSAGKGYLTKDDYLRGIQASRASAGLPGWDVAEMGRQFDELRPDQAGRVDWERFSEPQRQMFKNMDTDGDGKLSAQEYARQGLAGFDRMKAPPKPGKRALEINERVMALIEAQKAARASGPPASGAPAASTAWSGAGAAQPQAAPQPAGAGAWNPATGSADQQGSSGILGRIGRWLN